MEERQLITINKRIHGALKLIASHEGKTIMQYADDALMVAMQSGAGRDKFIKSIMVRLEAK